MIVTNTTPPGVYVEEKSSGARPIMAVGTSTAGFIGIAPGEDAPVGVVELVTNWTEFFELFCVGMPKKDPKSTDAPWPLAYAVYGFFQNGGSRCYVLNVGPGGNAAGDGTPDSGVALFEGFDEIAIVLAPGMTDAGTYAVVTAHCEKMSDRVAILDAPRDAKSTQLTQSASADGVVAVAPKLDSAGVPAAKPDGAGAVAPKPDAAGVPAAKPGGAGGLVVKSGGAGGLPPLRPQPSDKGFATIYYPWINIRDPFAPGVTISVAPSGHVGGVFARTDFTRGVFKAPANEVVRGAIGVVARVTPEQHGPLNDAGVNVIRSFPREGIRIWGARTLAVDAEWRYLNVRRLFSMIEKSISVSTRWIVFEPNDSTLWKAIRRDITAFLTLLWQQGALMGSSPEDAFFVKCDAETNPAGVRDQGIVRTVIGIAPVKPAEFVVFEVGQSESGGQAALSA